MRAWIALLAALTAAVAVGSAAGAVGAKDVSRRALAGVALSRTSSRPDGSCYPPPAGGQGITIPDSGVGVPYPSICFISGSPGGVITDVNVHLQGLTHTAPDDLDLLLVGPGGENAIVMSDAGGGSAVTNLSLVLDDEAGAPLPDETQLVNGSSY